MAANIQSPTYEKLLHVYDKIIASKHLEVQLYLGDFFNFLHEVSFLMPLHYGLYERILHVGYLLRGALCRLKENPNTSPLSAFLLVCGEMNHDNKIVQGEMFSNFCLDIATKIEKFDVKKQYELFSTLSLNEDESTLPVEIQNFKNKIVGIFEANYGTRSDLAESGFDFLICSHLMLFHFWWATIKKFRIRELSVEPELWQLEMILHEWVSEIYGMSQEDQDATLLSYLIKLQESLTHSEGASGWYSETTVLTMKSIFEHLQSQGNMSRHTKNVYETYLYGKFSIRMQITSQPDEGTKTLTLDTFLNDCIFNISAFQNSTYCVLSPLDSKSNLEAQFNIFALVTYEKIFEFIRLLPDFCNGSREWSENVRTQKTLNAGICVLPVEGANRNAVDFFAIQNFQSVLNTLDSPEIKQMLQETDQMVKNTFNFLLSNDLKIESLKPLFSLEKELTNKDNHKRKLLQDKFTRIQEYYSYLVNCNKINEDDAKKIKQRAMDMLQDFTISLKGSVEDAAQLKGIEESLKIEQKNNSELKTQLQMAKEELERLKQTNQIATPTANVQTESEKLEQVKRELEAKYQELQTSKAQAEANLQTALQEKEKELQALMAQAQPDSKTVNEQLEKVKKELEAKAQAEANLQTALQQKEKELQAFKGQVQTDLQTVNEQLEQVKRELEAKTQELQTSKAQAEANLQTALQEKQKELQALNGKAQTDLQAVNEKLEQVKKELEAKDQELQASKAQAEANLQTALQEKENELEQVKRELEAKKKELQQVTAQTQKNSDEFQEKLKAFEDVKRQLLENLDALQKKNLQTANEELEQVKSELKANKEELQQVTARAQQDSDDLQNKLKACKDEKEEVVANLDQVRQDLQIAQTEKSNMEEKIARVLLIVQDLKFKRSAFASENDDTLSDLTGEVETAVKSLEELKTGIKAMVETFRQEIKSHLSNTGEELDNVLEEVENNHLAQLQKLIEYSNNQLLNTQDELDLKVDSCAQLEETLASVQGVLSTKEAEILVQKTEIAEKAQKIGDLESQIAETEQNYASKTQELQKLQTQCTKLQNDLAGITSQCNAKNRELEDSLAKEKRELLTQIEKKEAADKKKKKELEAIQQFYLSENKTLREKQQTMKTKVEKKIRQLIENGVKNEDDISGLRKQIVEYDAKIAQLTADNEAFQYITDQWEPMFEAIKKMEQARENEQITQTHLDAFMSLQLRIHELNNQVLDKHDEIVDLHEIDEAQKVRIQTLEGWVKDYVTTMEDVREANEHVQEFVRQSEFDDDQYKMVHELCKQDITDKKAEIARLRAEHEENAQKLSACEQKVTECQQQVQANEATISNLETQLKDCEEERANIRSQLDDCMAGKTELEQIVEGLRKQTDDLQNVVKEKDEELAQCKAEYANIMSQLNDCTAGKTQQEELVQILRKQTDDLQTDLTAKHEELEKFKEEYAKISSQLNDCTAGKTELEQIVETLRKQTDDLQTDLTAKHEELEKFKEEYAKISSQLNDCTARKTELEQIVETLRKQTDDLQNNLKDKDEELKKCEAEYTKISSQLQDCTDGKTELEQTVETLRTQNAALQSDLTAKEAELKSEKTKLENCERAKSDVEEKLNNLHATHENMKTELRQQEERCRLEEQQFKEESERLKVQLLNRDVKRQPGNISELEAQLKTSLEANAELTKQVSILDHFKNFFTTMGGGKEDVDEMLLETNDKLIRYEDLLDKLIILIVDLLSLKYKVDTTGMNNEYANISEILLQAVRERKRPTKEDKTAEAVLILILHILTEEFGDHDAGPAVDPGDSDDDGDDAGPPAAGGGPEGPIRRPTVPVINRMRSSVMQGRNRNYDNGPGRRRPPEEGQYKEKTQKKYGDQSAAGRWSSGVPVQRN